MVLTGTEVSLLDLHLHQTVGKMYYSHRHHYKFVQKLSNQYVNYFGTKFLEVREYCEYCDYTLFNMVNTRSRVSYYPLHV